jgi:hypothetical protein
LGNYNERLMNDNLPANVLGETVRAVLMGQNQTAQHQLLRLSTSLNKGAPDTGRVPLKLRWRIFKRDHFVCRYCGRRTIFMPVLVALSFKFPEEFPFAGQNQNAQCHAVFWTEIAVVDSGTGAKATEQNAVTACYSCYTAKRKFPDPSRWQPKPPTAVEWDGLSGNLYDLCVVTRTGAMPYFFEWLKIIRS